MNNAHPNVAYVDATNSLARVVRVIKFAIVVNPGYVVDGYEVVDRIRNRWLERGVKLPLTPDVTTRDTALSS